MKISSFADRLTQALQIRKMSAAELSRRTNVAEGTISNYKKGVYEAKQDRVLEFSKTLNVNPAWLMGYDVPMEDDTSHQPNYSHIKNVIPVPKVVKHIPLYDGIACGDPRYADSTPVDTIGIPDWINADFAIRCHGDSMVNARIHDGDIVYIRQQPDVDDGQIAAVLIDDDATLKRVYHKPYGVLLMPANDDYEPIVYTAEDCVNIKIMGRAVAVTFAVK